MLRVKCPSCNYRLSFPVSVGGTSVACPHCKTWFAVAEPVMTEPPQPIPVYFASAPVSREAACCLLPFALLLLGAVLTFIFMGLAKGQLWD